MKWTQDGTLVEAKRLAESWGVTPQALGAAVRRGELFTLKVSNRLYYPGVFQLMDRAPVAKICTALGDLSPSEKMIFWMREHGGLAGRSVRDALESHFSVERIVELAEAWAEERGLARARS